MVQAGPGGLEDPPEVPQNAFGLELDIRLPDEKKRRIGPDGDSRLEIRRIETRDKDERTAPDSLRRMKQRTRNRGCVDPLFTHAGSPMG
jgi:hypothetical protein